MATAAVQLPIPSYDRVEDGSCQLRIASFPKPKPPGSIDSHSIASQWALDLTTALNTNLPEVGGLFLQESYWRDQLGLSWDFHTLHTPPSIVSFLQKQTGGSRIKAIELDNSSDLRKPNVSPIDFNGEIHGVMSFLKIDTDVGRGRGVVRLLQDEQDGRWKAYTMYTALQELKGHEETVDHRRPLGVDHGGKPGRKVLCLGLEGASRA